MHDAYMRCQEGRFPRPALTNGRPGTGLLANSRAVATTGVFGRRNGVYREFTAHTISRFSSSSRRLWLGATGGIPVMELQGEGPSSAGLCIRALPRVRQFEAPRRAAGIRVEDHDVVELEAAARIQRERPPEEGLPTAGPGPPDHS
jgi:hypothetical protein